MLGLVNTLMDIKKSFENYLKLNMFSLSTRVWLSLLKVRYYLLHYFMKLQNRYYEGGIAGMEDSHAFKRQDELIKRREFDVLVILDACRYDIFSDVIHKYIDGMLEPVLSPASVTVDWLRCVWEGDSWKDIVYVSASPMVNKRGLLKEFDARNKFLDVVEVWDWGWDEELSTVPPSKVNIGVRMTLTKMKLRGLKFPRDYKLVIHYVQPHAPYAALQRVTAKISSCEELSKDIVDIALRRLGRFAGKFSMDFILLGLLKEHLGSEEEIHGILYKAYRKNLCWVLEYVARLVSHLDGRIVITADHGELLGEYGLYFHMDLPLAPLRIVPWFTVK